MYIDSRRCHIFKCAGKGCKTTICRFLDTSDSGSTSNMRKHVVTCWGESVVKAVFHCENLKEAHQAANDIKNTGSIMAAFERKGKGKLSYSHRQHPKTETKCVCSLCNCHNYIPNVYLLCRAAVVRWVSESLRPFQIVNDRGFQILMKTGRPEYYLPSPKTVSRDVRLVFLNVRKRMAKMMQVSVLHLCSSPLNLLGIGI